MPGCSDKPVISRAQEAQTTWHYPAGEHSRLLQVCGGGNHLCVYGKRTDLSKKKFGHLKQQMVKIIIFRF